MIRIRVTYVADPALNALLYLVECYVPLPILPAEFFQPSAHSQRIVFGHETVGGKNFIAEKSDAIRNPVYPAFILMQSQPQSIEAAVQRCFYLVQPAFGIVEPLIPY